MITSVCVVNWSSKGQKFRAREESRENQYYITPVKGVSYLMGDLNFCKHASYSD